MNPVNDLRFFHPLARLCLATLASLLLGLTAAQAQPILVISDASIAEGNVGTRILSLAVNFSGAQTGTVTGTVSAIGLSGAFFQPLAQAYVIATLVSPMIALTVTPAFVLILLSNAPIQGRVSPILPWLHRVYDRLLAQFTDRDRIIGLAYDFQVVEAVPAQPWDRSMGYIITESRAIDCGRNPRRMSVGSMGN